MTLPYDHHEGPMVEALVAYFQMLTPLLTKMTSMKCRKQQRQPTRGDIHTTKSVRRHSKLGSSLFCPADGKMTMEKGSNTVDSPVQLFLTPAYKYTPRSRIKKNNTQTQGTRVSLHTRTHRRRALTQIRDARDACPVSNPPKNKSLKS